MNMDNEKENFSYKHRYFLQDYVFNLEGMSKEMRKKFAELLQSLDAEISLEADYTLIAESYFRKTKQMNRNDFYSLNFILDSIHAKKILPINNYRFVKKSEIFCCINGKFLLKTDSCKKYYEAHICCQECNKIRQDAKNAKIKDSSGSSVCSMKVDKNQEAKATSKINVPSKSNISTSDSKDMSTSMDMATSKINVPSKSDISTSDSKDMSTSMNMATSTINVPNNFDISTSDSKDMSTSDNKEINYTNKPEKRKNQPIIISDSDESDDTIGSHKIYKRIKNSISNTLKSSNTSKSSKVKAVELSTSDEDELLWVEYDESQEWWMELPQPHIVKKMMDELNMYACEGKKRGKTFHRVEMKLMISYLIDKNQIKNAKSYEPWKNMIAEGYLIHRTDESLRNNFRKTILSNLKKFNLSEDFHKQFSRLVDTATKRL